MRIIRMNYHNQTRPRRPSSRYNPSLSLLTTNIWIQVKPPLRINRNPLPRPLQCLIIQIGINNILTLFRLAENLRTRVRNQTMSVRMVRRTHIACRTAHRHVHLVIDSTRPRKQRPVQGTGSQVECTGVDEQESTLACSDHGCFGKADVIADGQPDPTIFRQIDNSQLVSRRKHLALLERDLARYIDIKQMRLAMSPDQRPARREHKRGIIVFLRGRVEFGDTPADKIRFSFCGDRRERVEGGGLFLCGRRGEQGFGVFGKVRRAVGGVETFGEDD